MWRVGVKYESGYVEVIFLVDYVNGLIFGLYMFFYCVFVVNLVFILCFFFFVCLLYFIFGNNEY